jgi:hypothetical protein
MLQAVPGDGSLGEVALPQDRLVSVRVLRQPFLLLCLSLHLTADALETTEG